jgi:hypothetical protein
MKQYTESALRVELSQTAPSTGIYQVNHAGTIWPEEKGYKLTWDQYKNHHLKSIKVVYSNIRFWMRTKWNTGTSTTTSDLKELTNLQAYYLRDPYNSYGSLAKENREYFTPIKLTPRTRICLTHTVSPRTSLFCESDKWVQPEISTIVKLLETVKDYGRQYEYTNPLTTYWEPKIKFCIKDVFPVNAYQEDGMHVDMYYSADTNVYTRWRFDTPTCTV